MLIKCENCSKTYDVPDDKWLSLKPHFFRCSVCGSVFKAPELPENKISQNNTPKIMPLAEIFTEHPQEETLEYETHQRESDAQIFEPVKVKKTLPWSKIIVSGCACITTVICLLFMITVVRLYLHQPEKHLFQHKDFSFSNTNFMISKKNNLFVSGQLVNLTNEYKRMPFILISLKNKKNKELQRQYTKLKKEKLEPKEQIEFNIGVENIHPDSFKIEIATKEEK